MNTEETKILNVQTETSYSRGAMLLQVGTKLQQGKYRIEGVLGQGGFGITYKAVQTALNKSVAIKEFFFKEYCERDAVGALCISNISNTSMVERYRKKFEKEARTISQLNHPNIISIHDTFNENGTSYYVMDYIDGQSLEDIVKRQGALSESVAIDYIKQVASALDYIHQRSINHLDVKPANIMVRQSDNKAILIDFGVSKQYDAYGGQTSTTPIGISHGYAPIEQYNPTGVSTFSPQTDIYSLGATLYKLVTGKTPPISIELSETRRIEMPDSLSKPMRNFISKCTRTGRLERFNSAKQAIVIYEKEVQRLSIVGKVHFYTDPESWGPFWINIITIIVAIICLWIYDLLNNYNRGVVGTIFTGMILWAFILSLPVLIIVVIINWGTGKICNSQKHKE